MKRLKKIRSQLKTIEEPLFKSYLFVQLDLNSSPSYLIRSTYGVSQLVRMGPLPVVVPEVLIKELQLRESCDPEPLFKKGESVQIVSGPFRDLEGVFQMADGNERALILIDFLGKHQKVWFSSVDLKSI